MKKKTKANEKNSAGKKKPVMHSDKKENLDSVEQDFAFGYHAVKEALIAKRGNKLFIQNDLQRNKVVEIQELAKQFSVPIQRAPKQKLDQLTDQAVHQGVVLGLSPFVYLALDDLIKQAFKRSEVPFLVVLDQIEDPHNFGSILRTADATGVDGIIIPKHRAVGITGIVAKTSTGAVEHVPVARVTNLAQALTTLKQQQFWLFGTDMNGTDYRQWQVSGPTVLIIGNEGRGMRPLIKKEVDELLTIPMNGHVQSLNASVAAGVLMYEAYRKRYPLQ